MAFFDELLDHGDLLRDVFERAGFDVGREAVESFAVGVKFFGPLGGEFFQWDTGGGGVADGFVIDVGDISDVQGGGAGGFKDAAEDIVHDKGAEVSNVGRAVNGGAAAVEAEGFAVDGCEVLELAGECVVELHGKVGWVLGLILLR